MFTQSVLSGPWSGLTGAGRLQGGAEIIMNLAPGGHDAGDWRGAGVVERGGLENRCAGNRTEGSNPSLSASRFSLSLAMAKSNCGAIGGRQGGGEKLIPAPDFSPIIITLAASPGHWLRLPMLAALVRRPAGLHPGTDGRSAGELKNWPCP